MSRSVSAIFREAAYAQETNQVFLLTIEISHPKLTDSIRVVVNTQNVVSGGKTYVGYPVDVELPTDVQDSPPQAKLTIDNISTEITRAIRSIRSKPKVVIQIILADTPDVVECTFPDFEMQGVSYDSMTVSGTLMVEDFTTEPFPMLSFTPGFFPGLF